MCDTRGLHKTAYLFDRDAEMIAAVINAVTNGHISAEPTIRKEEEEGNAVEKGTIIGDLCAKVQPACWDLML